MRKNFQPTKFEIRRQADDEAHAKAQNDEIMRSFIRLFDENQRAEFWKMVEERNYNAFQIQNARRRWVEMELARAQQEETCGCETLSDGRVLQCAACYLADTAASDELPY